MRRENVMVRRSFTSFVARAIGSAWTLGLNRNVSVCHYRHCCRKR